MRKKRFDRFPKFFICYYSFTGNNAGTMFCEVYESNIGPKWIQN